MDEPGQKLKRARERLNLRYRDVEEASLRIAGKYQSDEFAIALSRLADIENKGTHPSIYRLYTLCAIYRLELSEVMGWYGVDTSQLIADSTFAEVETTHAIKFDGSSAAEMMVPLSLDPGLDLRRTTYMSRMIQQWGRIPLMLLGNFDVKTNRYAWIGTEDWSMYPLLPPGALLLIDESRRKILPSGWVSEWERPVYFFELRDAYICSWAAEVGEDLIFQFHLGSDTPPRVMPKAQVDVIGQVVGIAARLDQWRRRRTPG